MLSKLYVVNVSVKLLNNYIAMAVGGGGTLVVATSGVGVAFVVADKEEIALGFLCAMLILPILMFGDE